MVDQGEMRVCRSGDIKKKYEIEERRKTQMKGGCSRGQDVMSGRECGGDSNGEGDYKVIATSEGDNS